MLRGFNPRAREGRDLIRGQFHIRRDVSIHAPARGATPLRFAWYQSSVVSIHAPARGATKETRPRLQAWEVVSIHAPARGATCFLACFGLFFMCFNPRAREGRDSDIRALDKRAYEVSIHAPARGATPIFSPFPLGEMFQSTRPRGARPQNAQLRAKQ